MPFDPTPLRAVRFATEHGLKQAGGIRVDLLTDTADEIYERLCSKRTSEFVSIESSRQVGAAPRSATRRSPRRGEAPSNPEEPAADGATVAVLTCLSWIAFAFDDTVEGPATMKASEALRAVGAAMSTASSAGLEVDEAAILQDSNKLAVRLLPCDVLARVAPVGHHVAEFEIELARRLAATDSPVAALDPRVEPRVYEIDGFAVTLWTYYPSVTAPVSPGDYADVLGRLHAGMRALGVRSPHFTDRVAEAEELLVSPDRTPRLAEADRDLLVSTLRTLRRAVADRGAVEQLIHGEPHPGNLLSTRDGLVFIDLETCCRGPVEFDLAHVPEVVGAGYPDVDQELLDHCRGLVLAMVAAWRWDADDQFPNRERAAHEFLEAVRQGPPWAALDAVMPLST